MHIKINLEIKETLENVFQERERFINSLSDKKIYGRPCEKHKIIISEDQECPLCKLEKKHKIKYKDEVEDVSLEEKKEKDKEKDRERKRKAMLDPEKKKKHYESVAKYYARDRQRKKEHSLGNQ